MKPDIKFQDLIKEHKNFNKALHHANKNKDIGHLDLTDLNPSLANEHASEFAKSFKLISNHKIEKLTLSESFFDSKHAKYTLQFLENASFSFSTLCVDDNKIDKTSLRKLQAITATHKFTLENITGQNISSEKEANFASSSTESPLSLSARLAKARQTRDELDKKSKGGKNTGTPGMEALLSALDSDDESGLSSSGSYESDSDELDKKDNKKNENTPDLATLLSGIESSDDENEISLSESDSSQDSNDIPPSPTTHQDKVAEQQQKSGKSNQR